MREKAVLRDRNRRPSRQHHYFFDLRDRTGVTQVVLNKELNSAARQELNCAMNM
jgi:aspartyl-tRNA synthetase